MLSNFKHITPKSIKEDASVLKSREDESARKRRPHHKSRRGCDTCRTRHMKCDEQVPECGQCLYGRRSCIYLVSPPSSLPPVASTDSPPEDIDTYVSALSKKPYPTSSHSSVDTTELLHHFYQTPSPLWMGSAQCQTLLQQTTPQQAIEHPFLLNAILAFSAFHISAEIPQKQQLYEVAGACYYDAALKEYREAMDDASVSADALFACCMLLTLLSFKHLSSELVSSDYSRSEKSLALDVVAIRFIGGPRILSSALSSRANVDQGVWKPVFRSCADFMAEDHNSLVDYPRVFEALTGLEKLCHDGAKSDLFDPALVSLRFLMQCYVSDKPRMVDFTFCFAINLDPEFLLLVEAGTSKALLVLCYWYALVAQVEQWWACPTAQIEGTKLLTYLRGIEDASIQGLLNFPAGLLQTRSIK